LAIAVAEAFPDARVIGIDIFAPALELARANISAANLDERGSRTRAADRGRAKAKLPGNYLRFDQGRADLTC
jgi:methylase of polypeptide subunit release factors